MSIDRRTLLRAGLGAATATALPAALSRALAIPADVRTGTIQDVAHVVILMQENRAFDHYFGTLSGVRGFGDRFPIPVPAGADGRPRTIWTQLDRTAVPPRAIHPFHLDTTSQFALMRMEGTPHSWPNAQEAWDNGRMAHWPEAKTARAMGYYKREDVPFQFAMADTFTLCDAYHCSVQTGTGTNRLFLWTGTNDPHGRAGGPVIDNWDDPLDEPDAKRRRFNWTTYGERLLAAGIDWRHYQDMDDNFGDNPVQNFAAYRRAWRGEAGSEPALRERALTTRALDALREDVVRGRLPQVSWIVGTAEGSEHPGPSSPAQGAAYTAAVIDALTADPKVWARTALFVMFDENDGFFDHVPPPAPPSPDPDAPGGWAGASSVSTDGEYHRLPALDTDGDLPELRGRPYGLGPRVPMYVLSPWSRGGWVNSDVSDHTSVIRFLEARFGVHEPNISPWRRAVCGDLTSAFDFRTPNLAEFSALLPDTRKTHERAAAIEGQVRPTAPYGDTLPIQEAGIRPSRALSYHLRVDDRISASDRTITLMFSAGQGRAGVIHVYDRLHLDRVPRRFTVAPGEPLQGVWSLAGDDGAYDLWLIGPNGFHRHFAGSVDGASGRIHCGFTGSRLVLDLVGNSGPMLVEPGAYHEHHSGCTVPAHGGSHEWDLRPTKGWYDLVVRDPSGSMLRRLAGRHDTGAPTITDPALL
jgi:phospholipase C